MSDAALLTLAIIIAGLLSLLAVSIGPLVTLAQHIMFAPF